MTKTDQHCLSQQNCCKLKVDWYLLFELTWFGKRCCFTDIFASFCCQIVVRVRVFFVCFIMANVVTQSVLALGPVIKRGGLSSELYMFMYTACNCKVCFRSIFCQATGKKDTRKTKSKNYLSFGHSSALAKCKFPESKRRLRVPEGDFWRAAYDFPSSTKPFPGERIFCVSRGNRMLSFCSFCYDPELN